MAPPLSAGAVQVTVLWLFSFEVPATDVGAPGTVDGVSDVEAVEYDPVPEAFIALTLKVYDVPLVRPVKTNVVPDEPTDLVQSPVTPTGSPPVEL